jgi:hypothetical protein
VESVFLSLLGAALGVSLGFAALAVAKDYIAVDIGVFSRLVLGEVLGILSGFPKPPKMGLSPITYNDYDKGMAIARLAENMGTELMFFMMRVLGGFLVGLTALPKILKRGQSVRPRNGASYSPPKGYYRAPSKGASYSGGESH